MYATSNEGKVTLTISPKDDPKFIELLDEVRRLQEELNIAINELRYYDRRLDLSVNFNADEDNNQ